MPFHYALSELLIVFAALYAIRKFRQSGISFSGPGVLWIAAAAAFGAWRAGVGDSPDLASTHKFFSQLGGLLGTFLIAVAFFQPAWQRATSTQKNQTFLNIAAFSGVIIAISLLVVTFLLVPGIAPLLTLVFAALIALGAFSLPSQNIGQRSLVTIGASIALFNFLFVRQSPALGPDISWHLFHGLIAVWIVVIAVILTRAKGTKVAAM